MGKAASCSCDLDPQETLLHFSARRGLYRVTHFLLQQPGAREALRLANRQGHTPSAVAELRGNERLVELLTQAETDRGIESIQPAETHTLTLRIHPGLDPPTLQRSVEQLLHLKHHLKGVPAPELHFGSPHTAAECGDGVEQTTAGAAAAVGDTERGGELLRGQQQQQC
ncbi:hypothetical protein KUCAC02_013283 [Chaenocephalus aceratus]|nr:hypothetical protein KUCAC02_013283 [Chaenocephalus aceratus]